MVKHCKRVPLWGGTIHFVTRAFGPDHVRFLLVSGGDGSGELIDIVAVAFATGFDFFERTLEVIPGENDLIHSGRLPGSCRADVFANGGRCRLAAERCEVSTDVPVRFGGQDVDIHVVGQRPISSVNVEYLSTCVLVRGHHFDVALDTSRAEQRIVDQVRSIRRGNDDHVFQFLQPVQFGQ